ncbi:hypothetical protein KVC_0530 [Ketogulonicigenium vulgare]|nr:hypothetical protein KVC_0530 [Ketogulonicigenium vulgare]
MQPVTFTCQLEFAARFARGGGPPGKLTGIKGFIIGEI